MSNQAAGSPLYVGLVERGAQARSQLDLEQQTIDPGDGAEQFLLADIDDLIMQFPSAYSEGR